MVVKVADFGLAKDVYETSYYRQMKESRLPIKWLAVESMTDRVFTSQSDVVSIEHVIWVKYHSANKGEVLAPRLLPDSLQIQIQSLGG